MPDYITNNNQSHQLEKIFFVIICISIGINHESELMPYLRKNVRLTLFHSLIIIIECLNIIYFIDHVYIIIWFIIIRERQHYLIFFRPLF